MTFVWLATLATWLITLCSGVQVVRQRGFCPRLRRLFATLLWGSIAVFLSALCFLLQAFHAFSDETLVARVSARRLTSQAFELTYTPTTPPATPLRGIQLRGDQWAMSGGIVKWHPWLTALGLKSYHKPIRLSGQFSSAKQQRHHLPSIYLLEPSGDQLWEMLYRAAPYLPFIEAVYGSSAYVYVEPGVEQDVYVTPSGYLIKRKSD